MEFSKLEKVEMGGIMGKSLSAQVVKVYENFQEQYKSFQDGTFDCLDPAHYVCIYVYVVVHIITSVLCCVKFMNICLMIRTIILFS